MLLENQKIKIELGPEVKELIASKGIDKNFGARPLRRAIQRYVEDEISEMILRGEVSENNTIKVELDGDKLTFKVE